MAAQPHQTNQITSSSDQIRDAASALPSGATTPKPNKSQKTLRASEQDRADVARRRDQWLT
jgi:hypothetical protein